MEGRNVGPRGRAQEFPALARCVRSRDAPRGSGLGHAEHGASHRAQHHICHVIPHYHAKDATDASGLGRAEHGASPLARPTVDAELPGGPVPEVQPQGYDLGLPVQVAHAQAQKRSVRDV